MQVFVVRAVLGRVVEWKKGGPVRTEETPAGYSADLTRARTALNRTRRWDNLTIISRIYTRVM